MASKHYICYMMKIVPVTAVSICDAWNQATEYAKVNELVLVSTARFERVGERITEKEYADAYTHCPKTQEFDTNDRKEAPKQCTPIPETQGDGTKGA